MLASSNDALRKMAIYISCVAFQNVCVFDNKMPSFIILSTTLNCTLCCLKYFNTVHDFKLGYNFYIYQNYILPVYDETYDMTTLNVKITSKLNYTEIFKKYIDIFNQYFENLQSLVCPLEQLVSLCVWFLFFFVWFSIVVART